nr:unnamed protein product [Spirometra erinaceieuropaei]
MEEVGAGYTFYWSGRPKAERHDSGLAFDIRDDVVGQVSCLLQCMNNRPMSPCLPVQGGKFVTTVTVYAPAMTTPYEARKKLYANLNALLATVSKVNKLIVLGDFNGRVGSDHTAWRGVLVPHVLDGFIDNGLLLLRRTPAPPDQHLLPSSFARGGHLGAPSATTLAPAGLCHRPEERPVGRAGDKDDSLYCRVDRQTPRHLLHADPSTASQETSRGVLNRPSTISDAAITRVPQVEANVDLDLSPSLHETISAVQQLSSGKPPG